MNISEIMTANPACCTPEDRLDRVAQMMVECDCGAIPVIDASDSGHPVGIVTDRDIVTRAIAQGKNPLEMRVRDVMTDNVITVTPESDIREAIRTMEKHQIRRLIVSDGDGSVRGIVAQADLARQDQDNRTGELVEQISEPSSSASRAAKQQR